MFRSGGKFEAFFLSVFRQYGTFFGQNRHRKCIFNYEIAIPVHRLLTNCTNLDLGFQASISKKLHSCLRYKEFQCMSENLSFFLSEKSKKYLFKMRFFKSLFSWLLGFHHKKFISFQNNLSFISYPTICIVPFASSCVQGMIITTRHHFITKERQYEIAEENEIRNKVITFQK